MAKYYAKQLLISGDYCFAGPQCDQHPSDFYAVTSAEIETANIGKALLSTRDKDKVKKTLGRAGKLQRINASSENPHLIDQWHPTLNNGSELSDYGSTNSTQKSWWVCPLNPTHIWDALIITRANMGAGCPFCSGVKFSKSNSLASTFPEIAAHLDNSKNKRTSSEVTAGEPQKMWWLCPEGHQEYIAPIDRKRYGCRDCNPRVRKSPPIPFSQSVAAQLPQEIVAEFNVEANGITPDKVSIATDKVYLWNCPKGHTYSTRPSHRRENSNCPYCSNKKVGYGNSLADTFPEVADLLLEEESGFKASEIVPGTPVMAWWRCPKYLEHTHKMIVSSKTGRNGVRPIVWCPKCTDLKKSLPEQKLRNMLGVGSNQLKLQSLTGASLTINWRKNKSMAVDILAETRDGTPVVIEYDGWYYHNTIHRIQRDAEKTEALLNAGYVVIRVREDKLEDLVLTHKNLTQIPYKVTFGHNELEQIVHKIDEWLMNKA